MKSRDAPFYLPCERLGVLVLTINKFSKTRNKENAVKEHDNASLCKRECFDVSLVPHTSVNIQSDSNLERFNRKHLHHTADKKAEVS